MVCDQELFEHIVQHLQPNFQITLGNPPPDLHTHLELHHLVPTEILELLGRLHGHQRRLRDELTLCGNVPCLRNFIGRVFENLAANKFFFVGGRGSFHPNDACRAQDQSSDGSSFSLQKTCHVTLDSVTFQLNLGT